MLKLDKSIYLIYGNFFYSHIFSNISYGNKGPQKTMLSFYSWLEGNVVKRIVV